MGIVGIIGKTLIIYSVMFVHMQMYAQGSVELSVRDMNGRKTMRVVVGQPFNIYVTMHEIDANKAHVTFENSRGMPMHRTSVQMRSINGRASTTFVYASRIDRRGMHTIGPVIVNDGVHHYESNKAHVDVSDDKHANDKNDEKVMLYLTASKTRAYVGETISFNLKCYYTEDEIRPERLTQPAILHAIQSKIEGPFTGSEKHNNTIYDFVEWRWDMIFEQVGNYTIPAYSLEYSERMPKQNHFSMLSVFFNSFGNTHHISSNAIECTIIPVPSHDQASGFVGSIHDFQATLDQSKTSVGKAVVLTLSLVGTHHNAKIQTPMLQDLPRALKYYESKNETVHDSHKTITRFEYIIQPLNAGEWEIPSQSFIYFDIQDNAYRTIQTNPLYLIVAQGLYNTPSHENTSIKTDDITINNDQDDIKALHEGGPWIKEKNRPYIPWYIFWILLALPLWCFLYTLLKKLWLIYSSRHNPKKRKQYARATAIAAIKRIKRTNSVHEIPTIFKQFFADTWQMPVHEITETYIQQRFTIVHIPYQEWHAFWTHVMMYAFAQETINQNLKNKLYEDSIQWLNTLDTVL